MNNWIEQFDFTCLSAFEISAFGMLNFAGVMISAPIVPIIMDKIGRKKVFIVNSVINIGTLVGMVLCPHQKMPTQAILYTMMFLNGLATGGRVITGYTLFNELFPDRFGTVIGTIWNCLEACVNILIPIYFLYISTDWRWMIWYAIISGSVCCLISVFFLPESPKWLYG